MVIIKLVGIGVNDIETTNQSKQFNKDIYPHNMIYAYVSAFF